MHCLAAQWIVGLLRDRSIPFLICGGLAAKGYGSERELNDIDLFVGNVQSQVPPQRENSQRGRPYWARNKAFQPG